MPDAKNKPNQDNGSDDLDVFRIGGREYRVGDKFSPEEIEDFFRAILPESGGPVSVEEVDESTGAVVRAAVDDWAEFEQGPKISEDYLDSFQRTLAQKGYLAYEMIHGTLKYHTSFRVLRPNYFDDFERFVRCQDIPDRYFGPVIPGESWFISHRWDADTQPDPSRRQFAIIRDFARRNQVSGIWYDYSCMPQRPHTPAEEKLFNDSLKHMNSLVVTTNFMSLETDDYLERGWCFFERAISELLGHAKRTRIAPSSAPRLDDKIVNQFVIAGELPPLKVTLASDVPVIDDLLVTGVDMFKMLAVGTTFSLLNSFGFQFGIGTAARFSQIINFGSLWTCWQILAGSSESSGIRLSDLLNTNRLLTVLTRRHERFGTHARFYANLQLHMSQSLDMRIVEQESSTRLSTLFQDVIRSGLVPEAYTKLALIELVYWLAVRDEPTEIHV